MADGIRRGLQQQPGQPIPQTKAASNGHSSMGAVLLGLGVSPSGKISTIYQALPGLPVNHCDGVQEVEEPGLGCL